MNKQTIVLTIVITFGTLSLFSQHGCLVIPRQEEKTTACPSDKANAESVEQPAVTKDTEPATQQEAESEVQFSESDGNARCVIS